MHQKEIEFCDKIRDELKRCSDDNHDSIVFGNQQAIKCLKSASSKLKDKASLKILEIEINELTKKTTEKEKNGEKIKKALNLISEVRNCLL